MKILAYSMYNSGPSLHRIANPLLLMHGVDVRLTNVFNEADFEGVDVVMYNRVIGNDYPRVKQMQEKHGFQICVDVDDHWDLDPHHILFDDYQDMDFAKMQIEQIKGADIVTTTHSRLAKEIEPFNANVHVLPNAIPKAGQFLIEREQSRLTRLFWQGSSTHLQDIELLRWPIDALKDIAGKIKMVIGGFVEHDPEWEKMTDIYTTGYKHQYWIMHGLHAKEYYSLYKQADICLIPLLNSPFNRHKSNLKVLEAANLGLPVIVSNVHPYLGLPVLYAKNSHDWVNHIKKLVSSKKRQNDAGAELKEYVDIYYNFNKINKERREILEFKHVNV